jgi:inner membrane protein
MPTVMTHALVGAGLGVLYTSRKMPVLFWLTTAALAMVPDLDVWAFRLGINYEAPLGHRGFTHSLLFALLAGCTAALLTHGRIAGRLLDLCGFFFLVTASHGLLDAFTNGGKGVGFLLPFDTKRYFFPWQPIRVSPIGYHFFSMAGVETLGSEAVWVWLPTVAVVGLVLLLRRVLRRQRGARTPPQSS